MAHAEPQPAKRLLWSLRWLASDAASEELIAVFMKHPGRGDVQSLALMRAVCRGAWLRAPPFFMSPLGPASFPQPEHPPKARAAAALTCTHACTEAEQCLHRSCCSIPKFPGEGLSSVGGDVVGLLCVLPGAQHGLACPRPIRRVHSWRQPPGWVGVWLRQLFWLWDCLVMLLHFAFQAFVTAV